MAGIHNTEERAAPCPARPESAVPDRSLRASVLGVSLALVIAAAWAGVLAAGFALGPERLGIGGTIGLMALSTFLHTGLFITVHDALHGTVAPRWPRVNRAIGTVAARLYAGFSWTRLLERHIRHHRFPGTHLDPDHHRPGSAGVLAWYLAFLREYVTLGQIVWMAVAFNVLSHAVGVAEPRLFLFWVLPALMSTVQLFVVGTWWPHRSHPTKPANDHHARSVDLPPVLSFLACYHFGYHLEHHAYPATPWWRLPTLRAGRDTASSGRIGEINR